jgi:hypothetical protein
MGDGWEKVIRFIQVLFILAVLCSAFTGFGFSNGEYGCV